MALIICVRKENYDFANFLAIFPIVNPCTIIENITTVYVIAKNSCLCIWPGSDKASATEMPPLNPPHVSIAIEFFSNARLKDKRKIGIETASHLASKTTGIAIRLIHKRFL